VVAEFPSIAELKRDYRLTYAEYARCVEALELIRQAGQPASSTVENAVVALERARRAHSAARDLLASRLGGAALADAEAATNQPITSDASVRHTAHLLWELSGQPSGTAERDWLRARQLVTAAGKSS
jgi:hypothetical protein